MSLKNDLHTAIERLNGEILTFDEFETICKKNGKKVSNGERRMRELTHCKDPEIEIITSKKGHIVGYCLKKVSYPYQSKFGFVR